jgi:hypothetical protein
MQGRPQIRSNQLITTYGPGAMLDLPEETVIISGIDNWRYHPPKPVRTINEPRLCDKIRIVLQLERVPSLRLPPLAEQDNRASSCIAAWPFPQWMIVADEDEAEEDRTGMFRRRRLVSALQLTDRERRRKRFKATPIRFVRACEAGHIGDIDWYFFVHQGGTSCRRCELSICESGSSGDLGSMEIVCGCGARRRLIDMENQRGSLGRCDGARPWLGNAARESCDEVNKLLIRTASNTWFPQLLTVISIPPLAQELANLVERHWDKFVAVENGQVLSAFLKIPAIAADLSNYNQADIMATIEAKRHQTPKAPIKYDEFEAFIRAGTGAGGYGTNDPDFRVEELSRPRWSHEMPENISRTISRVLLVHRLRKVSALVGFTRFSAATADVNGELDTRIRRAAISKDNARGWFPAMESRGEGIFIEFRPEIIREWANRAEVLTRKSELMEGIKLWQQYNPSSSLDDPGLVYYLLHSISHLLLTAIVLDCGYPLSSLGERIYAIPANEGVPARYGILLMTGASGSEGTLGGLVAEGERLRHHLARAVEMAKLCANDPICGFHKPSPNDQASLVGSACHGCLFLPETACEMRNDFLDRALVVDSIGPPGVGFFGNGV